MQALSCGSAMVTGGGMTVPELQLEKPEVVNPVNVRVAASKTELGTPKRAPSGSRLCPTPKSVQRAPGEMKTRASQTQESLQVHEPDVANLENEPTIVPNFTTYSNPAFEPRDIIGTPLNAPKQPPCIPVDSNGLRLCPTPKSTRSSTSPGASKLRFPKATAFQPLETIRSPIVSKDQTKPRVVLGDSNGQWTQETPKASKQVTTPRGRSATSPLENMAPRALFDNSSSRSEAAVSNVKKRARVEDEATRTTRSKTEAEKIATFLRSPAARVRSDGTREEYRFGVSDELVKKFMEKKVRMEKGCQCELMTACLGCDGATKPSPSLARSTLLRSPLVQMSEKRTPTTCRSGRTTPQGSAKKNLSVLLEAQK